MLHFCQNRDGKKLFWQHFSLELMLRFQTKVWEQGWCRGGSASFPPMWLGLDSRTRSHLWVEFAVVSCPCCGQWEVFLRVFWLSPLLNDQPFPIRSGMLERLSMSPWFGRLITTPHAIELNVIIDLILIDLNWPG